MSDHLAQALDAMEEADIDVLLLGRGANVRWVTGAKQLWLAGTRPFAPGCVVVRSTGAVHLLSITDNGVPDIIPKDHLYPISWNPMNLLGAVTAAPGVADATRVGVDGMSPLFDQLLAGALPAAELIDGEAVLRAARRQKSPDDIAAIRRAVTVAEDALTAVTDAIVPGAQERDLKGVFEQRMAGLGVTTPAFEGTFCVADPGQPPRVLVTDRALRDGDVVHLRAGVLRDGWEAWLSRTWSCGDSALDLTVAAAALAQARDECRVGASVGDVRAVVPGTSVDGVGMGHEELADDDSLEPGMVLGVEVLVDQVLVGDMVLVTDGAPELLTTFATTPA